MSYNTYPNPPAQKIEYQEVELRIQQLNQYYNEYMDILRNLRSRAIATGDIAPSDMPDKPPAITYP